jgi:nickel-dependent lactate racemase
VAALEAVKPGGTVIIASRNEEGCGSKEFTELLHRLQNPMEFYDLTMGPNYIAKDQWMIQELVNGLHHCELLYYTEGMSAAELRDYLVQPIASVEEGIEKALKRHGKDARILLIPEGPYVMPKIRGKAKKMYSWQTAGVTIPAE